MMRGGELHSAKNQLPNLPKAFAIKYNAKGQIREGVSGAGAE